MEQVARGVLDSEQLSLEQKRAMLRLLLATAFDDRHQPPSDAQPTLDAAFDWALSGAPELRREFGVQLLQAAAERLPAALLRADLQRRLLSWLKAPTSGMLHVLQGLTRVAGHLKSQQLHLFQRALEQLALCVLGRIDTMDADTADSVVGAVGRVPTIAARPLAASRLAQRAVVLALCRRLERLDTPNSEADAIDYDEEAAALLRLLRLIFRASASGGRKDLVELALCRMTAAFTAGTLGWHLVLQAAAPNQTASVPVMLCAFPATIAIKALRTMISWPMSRGLAAAVLSVLEVFGPQRHASVLTLPSAVLRDLLRQAALLPGAFGVARWLLLANPFTPALFHACQAQLRLLLQINTPRHRLRSASADSASLPPSPAAADVAAAPAEIGGGGVDVVSSEGGTSMAVDNNSVKVTTDVASSSSSGHSGGGGEHEEEPPVAGVLAAWAVDGQALTPTGGALQQRGEPWTAADRALLAETVGVLIDLFPGYPQLYEPLLPLLAAWQPVSEARLREVQQEFAWAAAARAGSSPNIALDAVGGDESFDDTDADGPVLAVGLQNKGNTCYVASWLQLMFYVLPVRAAVFSAGPPAADQSQQQPPLEAAHSSSVAPLLAQLQRCFAFLQHSQRPSIDPSPFLRAVMAANWHGGDLHQQQDASEFGRWLLMDKLEKVRPVSSLFAGELASVVRCSECGTNSSSKEPFCDIAVALPESDPALPGPQQQQQADVATLVDTFLQPEALAGDNQYFCSTCNALRDATKHTRIIKPPDVLVVTLKRFRYTPSGRIKVCTPVRLDRQLLLHDRRYNLVGVCVHSGSSAVAGHYYSYVHVERDGNSFWLCLNDDRSTLTSFDHIQAVSERFLTDVPYALFYLADHVSPEGQAEQLQQHVPAEVESDNALWREQRRRRAKRNFAGSFPSTKKPPDRDYDGPGGGSSDLFGGNRWVC